jgi:hypothetical protein
MGNGGEMEVGSGDDAMTEYTKPEPAEPLTLLQVPIKE